MKREWRAGPKCSINDAFSIYGAIVHLTWEFMPCPP